MLCFNEITTLTTIFPLFSSLLCNKLNAPIGKVYLQKQNRNTSHFRDCCKRYKSSTKFTNLFMYINILIYTMGYNYIYMTTITVK